MWANNRSLCYPATHELMEPEARASPATTQFHDGIVGSEAAGARNVI